MMEPMHSGAELQPIEDDFEWVNSWAAASTHTRNPAPPPPAVSPAAATPAPIDRASDAAPIPPPSPSAREADSMAAARAEPAPARDRIVETLPSADQSSGLALAEAATVLPTSESEESPPPAISEVASLPLVDPESFPSERRPWTSLFRLIAGGAGEPGERQTEFAVVTETVSADLVPAAAVDIAPVPQAENERIPLAPDQLERDIAEIEMVRDQLLSRAEPLELVPEVGPAHGRTSDVAPILVGATLGFILLVVFGAAALFVSLR